MKRYWVSWCCYEEDWRSVYWPPQNGVMYYWCTGYGDGYATLCAVVDAEDEAGVKAAVRHNWPDWDGVVRDPWNNFSGIFSGTVDEGIELNR